VPTLPLAVAALEITGAVTTTGAAATVIVRVLVADPPALVALRVTVEVAAAVGVPEITPLVAFTVSPAGSPVAL
jgi:hypothetical protein